MKPLSTNQRFLTWLCICPVDANAGRFKKVSCILFTIVLFALNLSVLTASWLFLLKYASTDLELSLYSLFQVSAFFGLMFMNIMTFVMRKEITATFLTLSDIYTASKRHFLFPIALR